jgi:transcriptional regulator with XRE-family HTH domain
MEDRFVPSGNNADEPGAPPPRDLLNVGAAVRRLRQRRGMSLKALAQASGISRSFLTSVERGETDISVGRLAQIAHVLGKDVATILGAAVQRPTPEYVRADEQLRLSRGNGVEFTATRVPHTNLEILVATFKPHTRQEETLAQPGVDVMYVVDGELVLAFDGDDYPVSENECIVWPSSQPGSTIRNDSDHPARAIAFSTEIAY